MKHHETISTRQTLGHIQALSGWAAIGVVLFHLGGALAAPKYFVVALPALFFSLGKSGVLLFFVLSGVIIYHVHSSGLGQGARVWRYTAKRALRLFPVYWAVLVPVAIFAFISGIGADALPSDLCTVIKTALLLPQNPEVVGGTGAPILIVAWSLQYEVLFDAAFALCILNLPLGLLVSCTFVAAGGSLQALGKSALFPGFMDMKNAIFFTLGIGAAVALRKGVPRAVARIVLGSLVAVAAFWGLQTAILILTDGRVSLQEYLLGEICIGLIAATLIAGLAYTERFGAKPPHAMLRYAGDCSYLIYLVHFPMISAAAKVSLAAGYNGMAGAVVASVLAILGTIVASALLHETLERPLLSRGRRASCPKFGGVVL